MEWKICCNYILFTRQSDVVTEVWVLESNLDLNLAVPLTSSVTLRKLVSLHLSKLIYKLKIIVLTCRVTVITCIKWVLHDRSSESIYYDWFFTQTYSYLFDMNLSFNYKLASWLCGFKCHEQNQLQPSFGCYSCL